MASEDGVVVSGDEGVTSVVGGVVSVGDGVVVSSGVASEDGDVVSGDEGVTSVVGGVVSVGDGVVVSSGVAGVGTSDGGWVQPATNSRIIRVLAIRIFFINASEVTLWLECYTTGGILSIV